MFYIGEGRPDRLVSREWLDADRNPVQPLSPRWMICPDCKGRVQIHTEHIEPFDARHRISHEAEARWLRILIQLGKLQQDAVVTPLAAALRRWRN